MDLVLRKQILPGEVLRKHQHALSKAMRELEREKIKMEREEKKIIFNIKKVAKDGQIEAVKIMAKDLVRTRRYVKKFMMMKANLQAASLKIVSLNSQNAVIQAMKNVAAAMRIINMQIKLPAFQNILQEFERQSEIMKTKEEIINQATEDAFEDDADEEESDAVVDKVLDELGLNLTDRLAALPRASFSLPGTPPQTSTITESFDDLDVELRARLDKLRKL